METPMSQDPAQRAAAAAPPPFTDNDIIKKIQELMTKINGNNEDPPQDVAQALSDAQATIEQFKAAAAEKAKNSPPPVSLDQNNGVNAQGQNVTITNADGSTTNPETGITTPASIIGNSPVVKASQSAAVPASMKGGYGRATAESVGYRDEQALARIVHLSRR
jgi:hypothetical protein